MGERSESGGLSHGDSSDRGILMMEVAVLEDVHCLFPLQGRSLLCLLFPSMSILALLESPAVQYYAYSLPSTEGTEYRIYPS